MAYKTDLQSNNTDLQSILDMILALGLVDAPKPYLTFKSDNPFTMSVATPNWDGTMYYSLNAKDWSEWNGNTISSANTQSGQCIYIRGTGNTKVGGSSSNNWTLTGTNIECNGDIGNLLDYSTIASESYPDMVDNAFSYLFRDCTSLTTAPSLPATTLASLCYSFMFYGCTSLTTAPSLPATTLGHQCYLSMFRDCTSLTTAPNLPATTLKQFCYSSMFYGCTSLTTAPSLPATTLELGCYADMFRGCTSLTTAPSLPATTLAQECYADMFRGCTSLTTAPSLPATTLAQECYAAMFRGCTKIKLSEVQTVEYTKAYRIPTSGTGVTPDFTVSYMFTSTGGTFTGEPSINTTYYLHESNSIV